jgi:hypothetical protein
MRKKLIGILLIGLMVSTLFPVISAVNQPKYPLEVQINIKGGHGFRVFIKNNEATDLNGLKMTIAIDGPFIARGCKNRESTIDIKAGETSINIVPTFGLGPATIKITVGGVSQTASSLLFGWFAFGVK